MRTIYRQGDVLIIPIDKIPTAAKKAPDCILAHGEVTGHAHRIKTTQARKYIEQVTEQIQRSYLRVTAESAQLLHEEHSALSIHAGDYEVIIQKEYTPGELRDVRD
jgi:hypothetical protein